jgi:Zn-dependent peptidase ImmA (M78 family)/DNA-binding XRE family transcriptional regulator
MARSVQVPITPSVLAWAIDESGLGQDVIAKRVEVDQRELGAWLRGQAQPSLTAFKKLALVLRRPTATFLLPKPPKTKSVQIEFRHPPGVASRELLPEERLRIREVTRLQDAVAWLLDEMGDTTPELPKLSSATDPEVAGKQLREILNVDIETQTTWRDATVAFREWRRALEDIGVLVFLLPMGADTARGFSIWNPRAPVVVTNTHWNPAARLYTLFHEFAHVLTRTNSVCVEDGRSHGSGGTIDLERWCEQVAAAALMPEAAVRAAVRTSGPINLAVASRLAAHFRVSLRAATLRLVGLQLAGWSLYKSLPAAIDTKRGGGGVGGRNRTQVRLDEYGRRTTGTFVRAVQRDVIAVADAMRYLDVSDQNLIELEKKLAA